MASKVVLTHLNFEGNEVQNVSLQKLATDPSTEALKNGMLWTNTSGNAIVKYNDNGTVRNLIWATGSGNGQTLIGGNNSKGNLTLQSTSHTVKGDIVIPEFTIPGFVKNDLNGVITGGNVLLAVDIPAHDSASSLYGDGSKTKYGHVKIGNGIAVTSGTISIDTGTGLQLTGTTPNQKLGIDSTVTTLTGVQTLTNKTLTTPTIADFTNSNHTHQSSVSGGTLDHGLAITGLLDDDHTQYLLLAGRSGGQAVYGGTAAGNNFTFHTTAHTTKGVYIFKDLTANRMVKTGVDSQLVAATVISTDLDPTFFSTDITLGGETPSDTKISSQKATKTYVDNAITGLSWKEAVIATTTANITLSGTQTIDGIAVKVNDRVLVKNQTNKKTNGIYIVKTSTWERAPDADTAAELVKATVFVDSGTLFADTGWTCSNTSIVEWTTDIQFIQFSGAGTYTGGTGIDIVGNDIRIDNTVATLTGVQTLTNKTITDNVITSLYQDTAKLNKITFPAVTDTVVTLATTQTLTNKTLTTPTITIPLIANFENSTHNHTNNAGGGQITDAALSTAVGTAKGGTNLTSYTLGDILYSSATNVLSKLAGNTTNISKMLVQTGTGTVSSAPVWTAFEHQQTIGNGTDTNYIITHNLNSRGVKISVWRTGSPYDEVDYYAEKTTLNTITLRFNRAIITNEFTVSVSI